MSIDVIIPVYRPTEKLKSILKAIQKQTYRPKHIILMHTRDGQDLDWIKQVCDKSSVIEIMVEKEEFDHGGTRDKGIGISDAEIVVFMTQDAVPVNEKAFEMLVKCLNRDADIAVAYARQIAGNQADLLERYTRQFNYPQESRVKSKEDLQKLGIKTYFCSNVCAAYKKDIYKKLGGFETSIIFNEDMVYAAKAVQAGYKIAYEAKAVVKHAHHYSWKQFVRRNFDLGVSHACYPEIFKNVKSEKEGIRLVIQTAEYLLKKKKPFCIIKLAIQSGCKYTGYQLGKHYMYLPKGFVSKLTMNPGYWTRKEIR